MEKAVFELRETGLVLTEIAPGVNLEQDILAIMDFEVTLDKDLKLMDEYIFYNQKMNSRVE